MWRKKWENVWDEVKYCSDRCRGLRHKEVRAESENEKGTD